MTGEEQRRDTVNNGQGNERRKIDEKKEGGQRVALTREPFGRKMKGRNVYSTKNLRWRKKKKKKRSDDRCIFCRPSFMMTFVFGCFSNIMQRLA